MRPALRTRWRPGPAQGEPGPHLISLTDFRMAERGDLPGIYRAAMGLRREWDELEGAVGMWLWAQPLRGHVGSVSLWRDEAALRRFVAWAPHVEIVRRYRQRGELRARQWQAPLGDFASHWAQGEARR